MPSSINAQILKVKEQVSAKIVKKVRGIVPDLVNDLMDATHVRTGLAQSNWIPSIHSAKSQFTDYGMFGVDWSVGKGLMPTSHSQFDYLTNKEHGMIWAEQLPKFSLGNSIWFSNSVPYGEYLKTEYSWDNEVDMAVLNFTSGHRVVR